MNNSVEQGILIDTNFTLSRVTSINSIEVEVATTYGYDLSITLTPPTTNNEFVLMEETRMQSEALQVRISEPLTWESGRITARFANWQNYTFVESGGRPGFISPYSPNRYVQCGSVGFPFISCRHLESFHSRCCSCRY